MDNVHFNIGVPKFITECIDRTRSLVVTYGRLSASESPTIQICFQGRVLHAISRIQLKYVKELDFVELGKKMDAQIKEQELSAGYRHEKLTSKAKGQLINGLMKSELLRYFGLLKKQKPAAMKVRSMVNQLWNEKEYQFDESPVLGKALVADIAVNQAWNDYTPPEEQKKRRATPVEQSAEDAFERVLMEMNFWLFGPVIER